jgi:serine/threonine-protein kinase
MTEAGSIVGTAQYLSPEQARGKPVDQRSDLYSLGIVMYEMLTGRVPFTGDAAVEIAMKHLDTIPDPPSKLRAEVSHDLDAVVMRALAKDPADRYASAEEMDADLARIARGASVSRRTEEAMTQALTVGASATSVMTAVVPREVVTPPPAPPAYRPPSYYEETGRRRSPWPMILGLIALAVAAVGGYLVYHKVSAAIDKNSPVAVSNVELSTRQNAELILQGEGLQTKVIVQPSATVARNLVISQNPGPGDRVAKDTVVSLTVSSGKPKTTVPTVVNLPASEAEAQLSNRGLHYVVHNVPSGKVPEGSVTAASPAAGQVIFVGDTVTLNVSTGPRTAGVPSVVNEPYANAAGALKGAGFRVVRSDVSNGAPEGTVIGQSPSAGTEVAVGSTVTVSVSKGPQLVTIPSVTQDDRQTATQLLQQAGLTVTVVQQDVTDPTQDGLVLAQDPTGGKVQQGSAVTITVGHLVTVPPTATTPTTTPATTPTTTPTTTSTTTPTTTPITTPTTTSTTTPTTPVDTATTTGGTATTPAATTPAATQTP